MSGIRYEESSPVWFGERDQQVSGKIAAFGIPIESRYGKAYEIGLMLRFCEVCAQQEIECYVRQVFYDSKGCQFEMDIAASMGDPVCARLIGIAAAFFGGVYVRGYDGEDFIEERGSPNAD